MTEASTDQPSTDADANCAGGAAAASRGGPRPRAVWLRALLPGLVAVGLTLVARAAPEKVEALYARGLYPRIAALVARGGAAWDRVLPQEGLGASRLALSELLLGLFVVWLTLKGWRTLRRGFGGLVRLSLATTGSLYLGFLLLWGLNHARLPLAETLRLKPAPVEATVLGRLADELGQSLAEDLASLEAPLVGADYRALAAEAWASRLREEPELGWNSAPVLRAPLLSRGLTAGGISGIFGPYTQECHVAAGLVPVDRAFVACHEIAHAQGWAREDEANYLAWRVGSRAESRHVRIGARALALRHVQSALFRANPELFREHARGLTPSVVELLEERRVFWEGARMETASRVASAVNDTYLRSQGHEGVASYGRMVDLLVAEWRAGRSR